MKKKWKLIVLGAVTVLIMGGGIWAYQWYLAVRCVSNLCMISQATAMYCMDHGDTLPARMSDLDGYAKPSIFVCPGTGAKPGNMTNVDNWMDYVYLPWGSRTNTPTGYPMLYDRRVRHPGHMINVHYLDGSTTGDKNARSLRRFAAEHPDINVPMPDGLN